jgi:plastocyanin
VTCTNVTIFQGAAIPPPGYNPNVVVLYGYDPAKVTLMLGKNNTVTWVNNDNTIHTATSTAGPQSFDSGNIPIGGSYSYTFGAAGTYRYHCIYHPWMIGAIVVESS